MTPALMLIADWALSDGEWRRRSPSRAAGARSAGAQRWWLSGWLLALVYVCYLAPIVGELSQVLRIHLAVLAIGLLHATVAGVCWFGIRSPDVANRTTESPAMLEHV